MSDKPFIGGKWRPSKDDKKRKSYWHIYMALKKPIPKEIICPNCDCKEEMARLTGRSITDLAKYPGKRIEYFCGNCNHTIEMDLNVLFLYDLYRSKELDSYVI